MNDYIYLVRYYDYDQEDVPIQAARKSLVNALAYIHDRYGAEIDQVDFKEKAETEEPCFLINGGEYGAKVFIEKIELLE